MFNKKIRAWNPKLKQMFKVVIIDLETNIVKVHPFMRDKYSEESIFNISDVILSQASGLNDENGLEGFEGDILDFEGTKCVFAYGNYGYSNKGTNAFGWHLDGKQYKFPYVGGAKKVGNIWENPEIVIGDNYVN